MIHNLTKEKVADALKMFPKLSDSISDSLPNKKQAIWHAIKSYFQKQIDFAFDESYQLQTYPILKKIDKILDTSEADKLRVKSLHRLHKFPEMLQTIMKDYQIQKELYKHQGKFIHRKNVMVQHWSFTQLIQFGQKMIEKIQTLKQSDVSKYYKTLHPVLLAFKTFSESCDFNNCYQDEISEGKIHLDSHSSFKQSHQSQKSSKEGLSLKSSSSHGELKMIDFLGRVRLESGDAIADIQKSKSDEIEKQSVQKDILDEQRLSEKGLHTQQLNFDYPQKNQRNRHIEVIDLTLEQIQPELNFNAISRNPLNHTSPLTSFERFPSLSLSSIVHKNQESSGEIKFEVSKTFQSEWENHKLYQEYSSQLINRYQKQSRFSEAEDYKDLRRYEVDEILEKKVKPLAQFLRKLPQCYVNNQQSFNNQSNQQVEIYGSFQNGCGFRKISDININISVQKLQHQSIPVSIQLLRNKLDLYKQKGQLNFLNLKSIISSDHHSVILSHHHNTFKPRIIFGNIANYIYITINNKLHVQSSKFMKEVIYDENPQKQQIRHLINFSHLVFK